MMYTTHMIHIVDKLGSRKMKTKLAEQCKMHLPKVQEKKKLGEMEVEVPVSVVHCFHLS